MKERHVNSEHKINIWAPWRMEYLDTLETRRSGCFLCDYIQQPTQDADNLVLWRGEHNFALLNRFPYTGGHGMIAPLEHVGDLTDLSQDCITEMMTMARDLQAALRDAIHPEGFNVGINIGAAAGAGLPDHLHMHVVPRWSGDTNFMSVLGDVRVIPEFLTQTRDKILAAAAELQLPYQLSPTEQ